MSLIRPILGRWLFNRFQTYEDRVIEQALDTNTQPKFHGLTLEQGRKLILTAEARAQEHPEELRTWFKYSRYYLYLAWYKVSTWLDKTTFF